MRVKETASRRSPTKPPTRPRNTPTSGDTPADDTSPIRFSATCVNEQLSTDPRLASEGVCAVCQGPRKGTGNGRMVWVKELDLIREDHVGK